MAPHTQKTETKYGQKEKTSSTVAGAIGLGKEILSGLGIKSFDDLKNAAAKAGQSIKDFAKAIGVKEEDLPQELGTPGKCNRTPAKELKQVHKNQQKTI